VLRRKESQERRKEEARRSRKGAAYSVVKRE